MTDRVKSVVGAIIESVRAVLVEKEATVEGLEGEPIIIRGKLSSVNGDPLADAELEIWH